ncbi:uncharacterized protein LOC111126806 [Crassostrea virginica]|uniref:Uncharacterized protein LOC111126806 n=1 Tax=Crassostrea virginica TaxID=6565 RepID=A0A8B8DGY7_CRAVI|nr:uncharacterized protein LOC111126806 [Crassostrea virginica]
MGEETERQKIMVEKFNQAFYESTIFLRISFFSSTVTLIIFLSGFIIPSWKYLEFSLDLNNLAASNPSIFDDSKMMQKELDSDSNLSMLYNEYEDWEQEFNFSYLGTHDFTDHVLHTTNLTESLNESTVLYPAYDTTDLFTAYVVIGLWQTKVCTKFLTEENCIPPFKTQGYNWIRRSRGFCILALGMALLTVVLILMCLFLSIAADMLLTHVMTLLTSIISVSSIVVGVLIFTTNHMKLDEETMVSNNMGMFQMSVSRVSWACWLSASATPSAAVTVLFLALNIIFF